MVGVFSFVGKDKLETKKSESIINFQEEELVTFTIFFDVYCNSCRGKKKAFSLSALFTISEQRKIYYYANNLSFLLKKFGAIIITEYQKNGSFSEEFFSSFCSLLEQNIQKVAVVCPICKTKNEIFAFNLEDTNIFIQNISSQDVCSHEFSLYLNRNFKILLYNLPKVSFLELSKRLAEVQTPYDSIEVE